MCLLDFDRHFTGSFLPSMPDDDMAAVTRGLKERLQWYTCPRGHPYTVGIAGGLGAGLLVCHDEKDDNNNKKGCNSTICNSAGVYSAIYVDSSFDASYLPFLLRLA